MKVLFDHQTFHTQRFGGISRYFYELGMRFEQTDVEVAISYSMNQYICDKQLVRYTGVPKRLFKIFEGLFRKANRKASVKALQRHDFDLFHPTYYDPYFLDYLGNKPFVLTIHDMTHERLPEYFSPKDLSSQNKRLLAQRATRIIAISECTKRDIIELLGVPEEKIDVVYHGINPQPLAEGRPSNIPDNYILYVGERRGYKNFNRTVEAFCKVRETYPDLNLVLTGRPLSNNEKTLFSKYGITDNVIVKSDITDITLTQLYRNARLFVYPSQYEGFGIPILEAFSQNCPVVLSYASCFPEVAGDAAEYFKTDNVDDMARAMLRVLGDEYYCKQLIQKGSARLSLFTWAETARRTEDVYRKALRLKIKD